MRRRVETSAEIRYYRDGKKNCPRLRDSTSGRGANSLNLGHTFLANSDVFAPKIQNYMCAYCKSNETHAGVEGGGQSRQRQRKVAPTKTASFVRESGHFSLGTPHMTSAWKGWWAGKEIRYESRKRHIQSSFKSFVNWLHASTIQCGCGMLRQMLPFYG